MITFGVIMGIFALTLVLGFPIAVSIGIATMAGLIYNDVPTSYLAQIAFQGVDSYTLIAIPMFILAGYLMETGGLSKRIVNFATSLIGNVTGGLAIVTVIACMIFAAISGSSPATVAAIGSMMIPSMLRKGYNPHFSGALTAASGSLGILIPPSIPMVIYGVTAEVSIGQMFMAGILPGILVGFGLMVCVFIMSKRLGYTGGDEKFQVRNVLKQLYEGKWSLLAPVLVLGGIYFGLFTPTEASIVIVVYSFVIGVFVHKEVKFKQLPGILVNAATTTGITMFILGFATAFARYITINQIPQQLGEIILSISTDKYVILLLFALMIFITGTFMETAAQILIYTPLFLPILTHLGVSPIHFGILLIIGTELGLLTPPVGVNLYVAQGISGSSLGQLSKWIIPFVISMLIIQIFLIFVPQIITFLPDTLMSK